MNIVVLDSPSLLCQSALATPTHACKLQKFYPIFPMLISCLLSTDCITNGVMALPSHLRKNNFRNPTDGTDCAFQLGYDTKDHFFEFLGTHPICAKQFNNHMSAYRQGRPSWMDAGFYDVPGLADLATEDEYVLIVDMGGSLGHDLSELRRKWPHVPGRFVLQDLPAVIQQAQTMNLHQSIETMEHDFFTEQPVKGRLESNDTPE